MLSKAELESQGVTVIRDWDLTLRCNACGHVWTPPWPPQGPPPEGFWQCPHGCNHPQEG